MNSFKVIGGVILALIVCFVPFVFFAGLLADYASIMYIFTIAIIIVSILFIFLSSRFVKSSRKNAAILALLICAVFGMQGITRFFVADPANFSFAKTVNYFGILIGALIGLYVSYLVFKNKGWNAPVNP